MRPDRRVLAAILVALLWLPALGAGQIPAGVDKDEYLEAATTILCDCGCHPQSVHDCECGRAAAMSEEIAAEVRGGLTGAEVVAAYVERFGEQIRIAPTATGFNLVAWVGPGLAFVLAAGGLLLLLRRWNRGRPAVAADAPAAPAVPGKYLDRLQADLEEYDT